MKFPTILKSFSNVKRKKMYERFHPLVKKALKEYCEKYKGIIKKRLK